MKKKKKNVQNINTFLGSQTRITGKLEFEGAIRIDGHFEGDIISKEGSVIVGQDAILKGNIKVASILILGEVNGNIEAENRIDIHPPGKMIGDIKAPIILIDPGVAFNGKCIVAKQPQDSLKSE